MLCVLWYYVKAWAPGLSEVALEDCAGRIEKPSPKPNPFPGPQGRNSPWPCLYPTHCPVMLVTQNYPVKCTTSERVAVTAGWGLHLGPIPVSFTSAELVGVSFPSKEGQDILSAGIWGAGGI